MKQILSLSIILSAIFFSATVSANDYTIDDLYEEFNSEMREFINNGAPYVLIKQRYNRLSNEYFKRCNIEFNKNSKCKRFQESFFHWYYNVGGQRICRFRSCVTN